MKRAVHLLDLVDDLECVMANRDACVQQFYAAGQQRVDGTRQSSDPDSPGRNRNR